MEARLLSEGDVAARFASAIRRGYWFAISVAAVTDVVVALIISWLLGNEGGQLFLVAVLIVAGVYALQIVYGFLSLLRASAVFFLYEKEQRISAVVDEMFAVNMPQPEDFYADAREYFLRVARSHEANDEARLFAGVTIGNLEALRSTNRGFLSMCAHIVLEAAIERYGKRVGTIG